MKNKLFAFTFFIMLMNNVNSQQINLEIFAEGFNNIVEIVNAGDERLFVLEQNGMIKIVNADGEIGSTPFLDISDRVYYQNESGLLGLAFHPDYQSNGIFFIYYINDNLERIIVRHTVSENPDVANPNGSIIMNLQSDANNHVGGTLKFDSNGYLWIALGDAQNPNNSQNLNSYFGKILRIDINHNTYTIPPDNPFIGIDGLDEIWAYGLRNSWKFSFDKQTNEVWIADVGAGNQNSGYEEINKQPSNLPALNYGWPCYEGIYQYQNCNIEVETLTFPFSGYNYESGSNNRRGIIGGYVYRGSLFPNLFGKYIFADYSSKEIGVVNPDGTLNFHGPFPDEISSGISSLGEGTDGQLYVINYDYNNSKIYKITDNSMYVSDLVDFELKIYPNPVVNQLTIKSNKLINEVAIHNIEGKLLASFTANTDKIDFANYPKGVYLVTIATGKVTKTQKVIKN